MLGNLFLSWALGSWANLPFNTQAELNIQKVWAGLEECKLERKLASDPSLLPPSFAVDEAIVNRAGQLPAYYRKYQSYGNTSSQWVAPDGGYVHSVEYSSQVQEYAQPYQGSVARAYINVSTGGSYPIYYCGQKRVSAAAFETCTNRYWADLIVKQLCRYGD